ncbi:MAG: peptidoglycan-binding domain-containing protein [Actinobacteria bacterium]|nr:peptidoglycan-binding domain-containing protein [Actinomycetota bacterium]
MLRGDDVAELQQRLSALGFDPGRVDGIFGGLTAGALAEFQRNAGLPDNAIASTATFTEIDRVGGRHTAGSLVTTVRERSQIEDRQGSLAPLALGLFASPELAALAQVIALEGQGRGLVVNAIAGSDDQQLAQRANLQGVELLLVLRTAEGKHCRAIHYEGYSYRSSSGADLGEHFATLAKKAGFGGAVECCGMSLPLLRETVMPAVILEFTDEALGSMDLSLLAAGLVEAMGGASASQ